MIQKADPAGLFYFFVDIFYVHIFKMSTIFKYDVIKSNLWKAHKPVDCFKDRKQKAFQVFQSTGFCCSTFVHLNFFSGTILQGCNVRRHTKCQTAPWMPAGVKRCSWRTGACESSLRITVLANCFYTFNFIVLGWKKQFFDEKVVKTTTAWCIAKYFWTIANE